MDTFEWQLSWPRIQSFRDHRTLHFQMTNSNIVLRIRWTSGGSRIVHTQSYLAIEEVLASSGFTVAFPSSLVVVYKGQIIDPMFSFDYYKMENGCTLVCHEKTMRLTRSSGLGPQWTRSGLLCLNESEELADSVFDKLEDQAFVQWEMRREFPRVMKDLLSPEDTEGQDEGDDEFATVVPQTQTINESPMPMPWQELSRAFGFVESK
jgi:hypothetical protein